MIQDLKTDLDKLSEAQSIKISVRGFRYPEVSSMRDPFDIRSCFVAPWKVTIWIAWCERI